MSQQVLARRLHKTGAYYIVEFWLLCDVNANYQAAMATWLPNFLDIKKQELHHYTLSSMCFEDTPLYSWDMAHATWDTAFSTWVIAFSLNVPFSTSDIAVWFMDGFAADYGAQVILATT